MKKFELWETVFGCWMLYVLSQFGNSTIHFIPYILVAYGCGTPEIWVPIAIGISGVFLAIDGVLSAYTEVHHYIFDYLIRNFVGFPRFIRWGRIWVPVVAVIGCGFLIYMLLVRAFLFAVPFGLFTVYASYVAYKVNIKLSHEDIPSKENVS